MPNVHNSLAQGLLDLASNVGQQQLMPPPSSGWLQNSSGIERALNELRIGSTAAPQVNVNSGWGNSSLMPQQPPLHMMSTAHGGLTPPSDSGSSGGASSGYQRTMYGTAPNYSTSK